MKKLFVVIFFLSTSVQAANYFVRPNGTIYGSSNGTSWTHAWSGFSGISWGTVSCGDTIWVAGGTYTQSLVPAKKCTSASPLAIRRARSDASAATSAAGWSPSFDSLVNNSGTNAGIGWEGDYDYIIISGRTTANGGSNGWFINRSGTGSGGGNGISFNTASSDNNTFEYIDMQGPGEINLNNDARGIDCTPPTGTVSGNLFSHMKIWDWESGIYAVSCSNPTFEYIDMFDIAPLNTPSFHPNGIITWGSPNGIVRYSSFHKGPNGLGVGEGIFFEQSGGSTNWQIYGNTFYNLDYTGVKALEISSAVGAIKVFNNTFDNILVGSLYTSDSPSCAGGEWRNNLMLNAGSNTCGTASNNVTAGSAAVFVNRSNHDYHLAAPTVAGATLAAPYNMDIDGKTRGADGTWDVGAFEYGTGGNPPPTTVSHPADTNSDSLMSLNEATKYGACWKNPAVYADCPAGIAIDYAVRAGTLWNATANGQYQYNSAATCPLCWEIKP